MNRKQLCCMRDISSPPILYYVIVLQIRKEVTTDALFIIVPKVMTASIRKL